MFNIIGPELFIFDNNEPKGGCPRLRGGKLVLVKTGILLNDGTFGFRGFHGKYKVQLTDKEKKRAFEIHLQKDQLNHWVLTLK